MSMCVCVCMGADGRHAHGDPAESCVCVYACVCAQMADMPMEILQNHSVNVIQQVHSDDPNPKVGSDVSQQPAMKENLDKTKA